MNTKVIKAVIYRKSAIITRECKVHLKKGLNNITLEGLSKAAPEDSIKLRLENLKYSNLQVKLLQTTELVGKVEVDIKEINSLQTQIAVKEQQKALWEKNSDFSQRKGIVYEELEKFIDNYSTNVLKLEDELVELRLDLAKKTEAYNKQFKQVDRKVITFDIESDKERDEIIRFNYLEPNVQWDPIYEIYADDDSKELQVLVKGRIVQVTPENWKDVKVELFTGNPTLSKNIPTLSANYLSFNDYSNKRIFKSAVLDSDMEYSMADMSEPDRVMAKAARIRTSYESSYDNVSRNDKETTTQYKLPGVWTVNNNPKGLLVDLYDYTIPVEISHLIIPRASTNGYLVAEVESNKLSDLNGQKVILYYNDNYIGKSNIYMNTEEEKTLISLGIDEKVIGTRKLDQYHSVGLSKQKDSVKVKLNINSSNSKAIDIIVKDILPKSSGKDVAIEAVKLNDGVADEEGIIVWNLTIEPNTMKEINFSYDITYPKKGELLKNKGF